MKEDSIIRKNNIQYQNTFFGVGFNWTSHLA